MGGGDGGRRRSSWIFRRCLSSLANSRCLHSHSYRSSLAWAKSTWILPESFLSVLEPIRIRYPVRKQRSVVNFHKSPPHSRLLESDMICLTLSFLPEKHKLHQFRATFDKLTTSPTQLEILPMVNRVRSNISVDTLESADIKISQIAISNAELVPKSLHVTTTLVYLVPWMKSKYKIWAFCSPDRYIALSIMNSSLKRMWQKFFLLLRMAMISPHWSNTSLMMSSVAFSGRPPTNTVLQPGGRSRVDGGGRSEATSRGVITPQCNRFLNWDKSATYETVFRLYLIRLSKFW